MLRDLNNNQRKAATCQSNYQMVIAGPGTGKTKTLIAKAKYLIDELKIDPKHVCLITFTNKSARELQERYGNVNFPLVTTFHGLGYQILCLKNKEQRQKINIISDEELSILMREIIGDLNLRINERQLVLEISKYKNGHRSLINLGAQKQAKQIINYYQQKLIKHNWLDFDDLLLQSIEVVKNNPNIFPIKYLLIDEFQDTNQIQLQLIKSLAPSSIFAIGDPLQSIYGFRGAESQIFDKFAMQFAPVETIRLNQHYRCRPEIINTSLALFDQRGELQSIKPAGGRIQLINTRNFVTESKWIINKIEESMGGSNLILASAVDKSGRRLKDFAVIFRTRKLANDFIKQFALSGLPYQLVGEMSPFQSPIVLKIINIFKFFVNQDLKMLDDLSLSKKQIRDLTFLMSTLLSTSIEELVWQITKILKLDLTNDIKIKVQFVLQSWLQFENNKNRIAKIVDHYQQLIDQDYFDHRVDKISVMTIHAVKGLEFDVVFIGGFEQGLIPHQRSIDENNIDEEKRLLFVAMTRAKEELYFLHTNFRYGQKTQISQFFGLI